jgi:hypothetical protein
LTVTVTTLLPLELLTPELLLLVELPLELLGSLELPPPPPQPARTHRLSNANQRTYALMPRPGY